MTGADTLGRGLNRVFGLATTIGMCVFAAVSAIFKVIRIDPAVVFSR